MGTYCIKAKRIEVRTVDIFIPFTSLRDKPSTMKRTGPFPFPHTRILIVGYNLQKKASHAFIHSVLNTLHFLIHASPHNPHIHSFICTIINAYVHTPIPPYVNLINRHHTVRPSFTVDIPRPTTALNHVTHYLHFAHIPPRATRRHKLPIHSPFPGSTNKNVSHRQTLHPSPRLRPLREEEEVAAFALSAGRRRC